MVSTLGLRFSRTASDKLMLLEEGEEKLSAWMSANMAVGWIKVWEPWAIEKELIRNGPLLPLNIRGSSDPYSAALGALRQAAALARWK